MYGIKKRLNIPEYKITEIISESKAEIHLRMEPYKKKPFVCSGCGQVHKTGYHGREESTAEDLPIFEKRTYLRVTKRRPVCPNDNRLYVEEIPWLNKWDRATKKFAQKVNRLTAITTNQEAGWFFGLDDEAAYRIDKEILEAQYNAKLIPPPVAINISVDEVSHNSISKLFAFFLSQYLMSPLLPCFIA